MAKWPGGVQHDFSLSVIFGLFFWSYTRDKNVYWHRMCFHFQCCERKDPTSGRQSPCRGCIQPQHALQVERPTHPDLTSACKPVGKKTVPLHQFAWVGGSLIFFVFIDSSILFFFCLFFSPCSINNSLSLCLKLPHSSAAFTMSQQCNCATQTHTLWTPDK